jgi:hypothetical protein
MILFSIGKNIDQQQSLHIKRGLTILMLSKTQLAIPMLSRTQKHQMQLGLVQNFQLE